MPGPNNILRPLKIQFSANAWRRAGSLPRQDFDALRNRLQELARGGGHGGRELRRVELGALKATCELIPEDGVLQLLDIEVGSGGDGVADAS